MVDIQIFGGPEDGYIFHHKSDIPPMTICVLEPLEATITARQFRGPETVVRGDLTITRPGESMIPEIVETKVREMPVMKRNDGKYYARWDLSYVR